MKKQFLLLTLFACFSALAQLPNAPQKISKNENPHPHIGLPSDDREAGDVIYENDFSDFGSWMVYTESGTTPQWELVTTTPSDMVDYVDVFYSPTNANGFGAFNGIQYLLEGTVLSTDALLELTSPINCTDHTNIILEFYMAYRAFNFDKIFLEVTNNDWASFEVFELFEELPTNASTQQRTIRKNITTAAGGESVVRIRFRFQELDGDLIFGGSYGVMVDDLLIREAWNYDQELTKAVHRSGIGISHPTGLDYYLIPASQVTDIYFTGISENLGNTVQIGAKLNVEISEAGSFFGTSELVDLPLFATDTFTCATSYIPPSYGNHAIKYWVDSDNPEEEPNNDTLYSSFEVTDDVYARHNGLATSSIANVPGNIGNPFLIGNTMDIFADDYIGAVYVSVSNDPTNIGKLIFAQIMFLEEDGSYTLLGTTEDHSITASENGGFIELCFVDDNVEVNAGQTILALAGHYGGDTEVRFRLAQSVEEETVLGYTYDAPEPFYLTHPRAIMLSLTTRICEDIPESIALATFSIAQNSPNPCNENTILPYNVTQPSKVEIVVSDLTGKIIFQEIIENASVGANIFELNTENFPAGTYSYTFIINGESLTKKMMVVR
ncbi:MAG: T9SS type A sorting domain-containing protein [Crocinitomix sp.]|nr:T9SS type A sorting domain-containing protein [Crocinitomix sp.]